MGPLQENTWVRDGRYIWMYVYRYITPRCGQYINGLQSLCSTRATTPFKYLDSIGIEIKFRFGRGGDETNHICLHSKLCRGIQRYESISKSKHTF